MKPGPEVGRRIVYLAPGDVLKGRVEPLLWMRTCEALAAAGRQVVLIAPRFWRRENVARAEVFEHFGVAPAFELSMPPTLLSSRWSSRYWVRLNLLAAFSFRLLPFFTRQPPVFFSKGQICLQVVRMIERLTGKRAVKIFELHSLGPNPRLLRMLRRMDLVVANSRLLVSRLVESGVDPERIVQVYNPPFAIPHIQESSTARARLSIPDDVETLTYAGKVTPRNWRFLAAVARCLREDGVEVHVVGGSPQVIEDARAATQEVGNLRFHGFVPPAEIGFHLSAADFLFCSYPDDQVNIEEATPAKYFDYMHAGKPVLCSNNTAIRELWEHGRNCLFFDAEDAGGLREQLLSLRRRPALGASLVENNRRLIETLTWDRRIETILDRLGDLQPRMAVEGSK